MKCKYCHKEMEYRIGYWYCDDCNAGMEEYEDDNYEYDKEIDPTGETSGSDDYFSSRPWN